VSRILFFVWGILGFITVVFNYFAITALEKGIGVGTSMWFAAGIMLWIGGMVLFAGSHLLLTKQAESTSQDVLQMRGY
jgi:hypothetical protein